MSKEIGVVFLRKSGQPVSNWPERFQEWITVSLIKQRRKTPGLYTNSLRRQLRDRASVGSDVCSVQEVMMKSFEGINLAGIELLLQSDAHAAVLPRVLQVLQRTSRIEQLR